MASECLPCAMCKRCSYSFAHLEICPVVASDVLLAKVAAHDAYYHRQSLISVAKNGNEIEVMRVFVAIVHPQINLEASRILSEWLMAEGELDMESLPDEIPKLWKWT